VADGTEKKEMCRCKKKKKKNIQKIINLATPNKEVVDYVLDVAEYWISDMDLDGFRLDVPNEVPFWFWELFRDKVKGIKEDAYLVGELWSNAVDWVNNDYFDAVMNYAYFKDPVMRFFNQRSCSAKTFDRDLKQGLLSYPVQATQVMMNLIETYRDYRSDSSLPGLLEPDKKVDLALDRDQTFLHYNSAG
jgi:glycosidase